MLLRCFLMALPLVLSFAGPARADGTVFRASGCGDRLYVSSENGFSVLVTDGGGAVRDGDELTGNVERIGQATLFDRTTGQPVFAQVEERHLSRAEIAPRITVHCRSPLAATFTSGYVSRAQGCGSKIFVNTAQGYTVLERIAGGVVAEGDTLQGNFNRPGRATVEDRQSNSTLTVFVEDLWLSKSAAERQMRASCRR